MSCCFSTLCIFISLISLIEFSLGIYLTFIQNDFININRLIKTERYDLYLFYIIFIFIGLGFISLITSFFSIYTIYRKLKTFTIVINILWIFLMILHLLILIILIIYYFILLPQLRSLLIQTLEKSPLIISNQLDDIQQKFTCCGFLNQNDYHKLSLDPFPSSCCRIPNCWRDTDFNNTISLIHPNGCYPIIEKYLIVELWIFTGISSICVILQFIAIIYSCILYKYLKRFDQNSKLTIHFPSSQIQN